MSKSNRSGAVAGVILTVSALIAGAAAAEPVKVGDTMEGVRNARYCEIIPIVRDGLHLTATVYNTLGHNDCPPKIWEAITEDAVKQRFGALMVLMNGPRYFIMDEIAASGASASGKTIDVDGMELTERTRPTVLRHHGDPKRTSDKCIARSRPLDVTEDVGSRVAS